jgi:hypothetical protein
MKNQKGMTLFIAIVIMSVLLFISFAVINIALKSILFASSGRDSQYAFYAADAGLECAMYFDSKFDKFNAITDGSPINCDGVNDISTGGLISGSSETAKIGGVGLNNPSIFGFTLNNGSNAMHYCAIIRVTKSQNIIDGSISTHIDSRGYNTCDTANLRRVERGIEVTY